MPIYDYECRACGHEVETWAGIEEMELPCECGGTMIRLITTSYTVAPDLESYVEENLGPDPVRVKGKQHLERLMKERGLSVKSAKGKEWW